MSTNLLEDYLLAEKVKNEAQKPFLKRLEEVMEIIVRFFKEKSETDPNALNDPYFDLSELKNLDSDKVSITNTGISISWSGYNYYKMFMPRKYISMSDEAILETLKDENIGVFEFWYKLT